MVITVKLDVVGADWSEFGNDTGGESPKNKLGCAFGLFLPFLVKKVLLSAFERIAGLTINF